MQSPAHMCYFLSSLCLLLGPGAGGHCLAWLRLAHLSAHHVPGDTGCAPSSFCVQVIHADGDVIPGGLPLETGALRLFTFPVLCCSACRGEEGHKKQSIEHSRFQIKTHENEMERGGCSGVN